MTTDQPKMSFLLRASPASLRLAPPGCLSLPTRLRHDDFYVYPEADRKQGRRFRRYTLRMPFKHGFNNNVGLKIEGVSDKQYPVMLQWERPAQVQRTYEGFEGSGDMEGMPEMDMNR